MRWMITMAALLVPLGASAQWGAEPRGSLDGTEEPRVDSGQGEEGGMMDAERARQMVDRVRASMSHEPTPRETVRAALRYFRVTPDVLDDLRSKARARAVMPTVTGSYRWGDADSNQFETQRITDPRDNSLQFARQDNNVNVSATWDFREAVFNGDQVQVYSLIGVQRDLMLEVLRAYFARRQLALTVALLPPDDPIALASLILRVEEFTAVLDMLTGGWFGDELEERNRNRRDAAE